MNIELNNNRVYLVGKVVSEPVFSHEIYGEGFYDINLEVDRLSSQIDIIPITISEFIGYSQDYDKVSQFRTECLI